MVSRTTDTRSAVSNHTPLSGSVAGLTSFILPCPTSLRMAIVYGDDVSAV